MWLLKLGLSLVQAARLRFSVHVRGACALRNQPDAAVPTLLKERYKC